MTKRKTDTSTPPTPAIDDVEELLEHAGDATHKLWFYRERGGAWDYLGSVAPAHLRGPGIREYSRARWGGGHFRAKLRGVDGKWSYSRMFTVEGAAIAAAHDVSPSSSTSSAMAPAASSSTQPPVWLDKFLMPFAGALGTALAGYIVKKMLEGPQADPIVLELLKRGGAGGHGVDPLELEKLLTAREDRGEQRGRELGKLRAIAESDKGGKEPAGALGAIERGLPQVLEVLKQKIDVDDRRERRLMTRGHTPAPGPATDAPADEGADASATPDVSDPLVALLLGVPMMARKFLLSAAEGNEPPEIYAAMIATKLDELTMRRLPALLERADFVDVFVREYPAFEQLREWVEELRDALKATVAAAAAAEISSADDDEPAAGAGAGD